MTETSCPRAARKRIASTRFTPSHRDLALTVLLSLIVVAATDTHAAPLALTDATATAAFELAVPREPEYGFKQELSLKPELHFALPGAARLTTIGRLRTDFQDYLEPGTPNQTTIDPLSRRLQIGDRTDLELREFYVEASAGDIYFKLGKQQIVWGTADGLKVLDVVNPQSFREFILSDFEDSRIPLWTFNAETRVRDLDVQFILIPDQTYHELPDPNSPFAITAPRFVPPAPAGVPMTLKSPDRPDRPLADADTGLRIAAFRGGWDLSMVYLYHHEDIPVPHRDTTPAGLSVTPEYNRVHLFGGTFARAFGPLTLRGELGYTLGREYAVRDPRDPDGVGTSNAMGSVVGLDWAGFEHWFVSFQTFVDRVTDAPGPLFQPRTDTTSTLFLRRLGWNDTLALELRWLTNVNDGDGLLRPKVSYDINDRVTVWGGVDLFYGDRAGIFGEFDHNDRAVLGVKYGF